MQLEGKNSHAALTTVEQKMITSFMGFSLLYKIFLKDYRHEGMKISDDCTLCLKADAF